MYPLGNHYLKGYFKILLNILSKITQGKVIGITENLNQAFRFCKNT
ncbi:hypothetical protein ADIS_0614 [Lunatimonas lonarensis]|uniref:Uncharacterized protein n=1 Tax=Lunatimonas lonarensis TaxID=1232681 RepID=R7ZXB9_9BACT|nr:hypothetical protein ADIS_0614 [Lunatimonas lonarensis]